MNKNLWMQFSSDPRVESRVPLQYVQESNLALVRGLAVALEISVLFPSLQSCAVLPAHFLYKSKLQTKQNILSAGIRYCLSNHPCICVQLHRERKLWNLLCGLSVSYAVHIHAMRRSSHLLLNPSKAKEVLPTSLCHPSHIYSFIIPVQHFQSQCLHFVSHYWIVFKCSKSLDLENAQANDVNRTKPFHCWFSETLSSVPELLLTLKKSSLCLLECISDLCLLLPIWSNCLGSSASQKQPGTSLCCPG